MAPGDMATAPGIVVPGGYSPARQVAPSALTPPGPTACSRQVIPAGAPLAETWRTLPQAEGETLTEAVTPVAGSLPEKVRQAVGAVGPGCVARLPTDPVVASHVPPAAAAMNVREAAAPASCRRQVLRRRAAACWSSLSSTPACGTADTVGRTGEEP